jgi:hypothetical protein
VSVIAEGLERARTFLASMGGAAEKATARALNKAAAVARDEAVDRITERYAVKPSDVREKITLTPATPEKLVISIVARSGPLSLTYFPHTPTEIGTGGRGKPVLRAEVLRGQEKTVPGAFIAPINGKPRIMIRSGGRTATNKAAIKSVATVPIASMLGAKTVQAAVEDRAYAVFDEQLNREIDRELGRGA